MAIERVDSEKCIGCAQCFNVCYADVFRMDVENSKSQVKYPQDCAMCCWCVALCPVHAIELTPVKTSPVFTSWG
jgi:NAD-dependent dihydropyrimidine dehydrogenase PreA subunit